MLAISIDRLLAVTLKSSYAKVCSLTNTKITLAVFWIIGVASIIGFSLGFSEAEYHHQEDVEYEIYLVLDIVFMVAAIVSYAGVVIGYRGYKQQDDAEAEKENPSVLTETFVIPLLIILTYFIFIVLPHWIYLGYKYHEKMQMFMSDPWAAMLVMLLLGYLSDAVVYIFLQAPVRKLLARWMRCDFSNEAAPSESKNVEVRIDDSGL